MRWALRECLWRVRRSPGARRWLSRRSPEDADPEDGGAIPFSGSKAGPRAWSVRRSMGSDYERSWVKVLPLSLLCSGLLLWAALRESSDVDRRLEAVLSGQAVPAPGGPDPPSGEQ